jgi:hypothetical protein
VTVWTRFRPEVLVGYDEENDRFQYEVAWDDALSYDEDSDDGDVAYAASEWLTSQVQLQPALRSSQATSDSTDTLSASLAAPAEPASSFLTCKHFCPSSEETTLSAPKDFPYASRFPFPTCINRELVPAGFGPCRAYGVRMPRCQLYEPDPTSPVALIRRDDSERLVSTARVGLGESATLETDPTGDTMTASWQIRTGPPEDVLAEERALGAEVLDPPTQDKPSFLSSLVA